MNAVWISRSRVTECLVGFGARVDGCATMTEIRRLGLFLLEMVF